MKDIQQLTCEVQEMMSILLAEAVCVAQEWDNRIDCIVRLNDGSTFGEMIDVEDLTEERIRDTAFRLKRKLAGENVHLINGISAPDRINRE